jgi:hypothetical protein
LAGRQTATEYCIWFLSSKLFFDVLPFVFVETVMTKVNKLGKGVILLQRGKRARRIIRWDRPGFMAGLPDLRLHCYETVFFDRYSISS